jgi:predicted type IV restriction endonuclease
MLGFPILDPLPQEEDTTNQETKLYCRGSDVQATGEYTEDGLVVFEGSTARLDTTPSVPETVKRRRQKLRADGVLEKEGNRLVFQEKHAFNSPSAASGVVLGRSSNGWREWNGAEGHSLDELERQ